MKKLVVVLMAMVMTFSICACGAAGEGGEDAAMINANICIDYPDDCGIDDVEAAMIIEEGTSAMDMLYAYADQEGFELTLSENSQTVYFTAINGVEETADAGWVYEVDGEMTMDAADDCIVTEGMTITWEYMSWSDWSE